MWNYINKILIAPILILTFLFPLITLAGTWTVGKTTDGGSFGNTSTDAIRISRYFSPLAGVVTSGTTRVHLTSAGSSNLKMVIFSDNAGNPDTRLAVSDEVVLTATAEAGVDFTFSGSQQITLSQGVAYWIGIAFSDPGTPNVQRSSTSPGGDTRYSSDTYGDGVEATFTEVGSDVGNMDTYVTITTSEGGTHTLLNPNLTKSGLRLDMDGVDEHGKSGNDPTGNTDTTGSISCWVVFDTVLAADGVRWIFGMGGDDTDQATQFGQTGLLLRRQASSSTTNKLEIFHRVDGSATTNTIRGGTTISTGTLYNVISVSSGTAYTLYLNGVAETLTVGGGSNNGDWFGDLGTIGTRHYFIADAWRDGTWAGNTMDGKMDNCATFSTALSATDAVNLYNGGKPIHPCVVVDCANVNNFWKLGEDANGTVTTMHDAIGSASVDNFTMENMESADIIPTSYY